MKAVKSEQSSVNSEQHLIVLAIHYSLFTNN